MIKFQDFIFENVSYHISFLYNGENKEFNSSSRKGIYTSVIDWLYENKYVFKGTSLSDRLLTLDQVKNIVITSKTYRLDHFHNIKNSGNFIVMNAGIDQLMSNLVKMLSEMGINKNDIQFSKEENEVTEKTITANKTWLNATIDYLKSIGNKPQTVEEIWSAISEHVKTSGKTPLDSLRVMITHHYPTNFETIEGKPRKYKLSEVNNEIINDVEKVEKIKIFFKNPFRQSICVLGESGVGKSVTIETILENEGHNFEFIIPTAATTGLLAQFSPSKSGYVPSRLGKMLMEASKNPQTLYTAVFDEMHKSNVIEMINDELLQAISTKRNRGRRFISLDQDTAEIYEDSELEDDKRGNLLIPDNFGFIFISSKPRVIANNADFFNRVDIVLLKSYQEEKIETTEQLLSNKLGDEEKMKLASKRND